MSLVLGLGSSIPVLGLESVCPRKGCPWPWPRIFFVSLALASWLVSSTPPLIIYQVIENPIQMCDSECLWIKIKNFDAKFTLGIVYRHPRTQTALQFLEDFSKCLDSLNKDSEYYYILGDININ